MNRSILLISTALLGGTVSGFAADFLDWGGIPVIPEVYIHKINHAGTKIVGEIPPTGGTFYFDIPTQAYAVSALDWGRGYVVSDNGFVVGGMTDEIGTVAALFNATTNTVIYPKAFASYPSGNIHSITPDGSTICGVLGNPGRGQDHLPYIAHIDSEGQVVGEIEFLPYPPKDFFGYPPQYASATWINSDATVAAGQVIDSRGMFVYPIVYTKDSKGQWSYSLPSESLFNLDHLTVPEPVGEFEEMFPDVKVPDIEDYLDDEVERQAFEDAYNYWAQNGYADEFDPYAFGILSSIIGEEKTLEYYEAEEAYYDALQIYMEYFDSYMDQYYAIIDSSVGFLRNSMALSGEGNYLASSADVPGMDLDNFVPYLFDLTSGEVKKIGKDTDRLLTNIVFDDGKVMTNTALDSQDPGISYIYVPEKGEFISFYEYMEEENVWVAKWMKEYLTCSFAWSPNVEVVLTGQICPSDDFETIAAGADGYVLGKDMYLSYYFANITAGVETIDQESAADGIYRVYNLQGHSILTTSDKSAVTTLPRGIYIINGKKIKI